MYVQPELKQKFQETFLIVVFFLLSCDAKNKSLNKLLVSSTNIKLSTRTRNFMYPTN